MAVKALLDASLFAAVAVTWFGAAAFARLRTSLDRLHCVVFVNLVAGVSLSIGAFASDGVSNRSLTVLFIVALELLAGAALSHAMGRAFHQRGDTE